MKHSFFQKIVSDSRRGASHSHNEAIFDKWHNKFAELLDSPMFNEKKHKEQTDYYIRSLHRIKGIFLKMVD